MGYAPVRYKIAMGLASIFFYLHEECEPCEVHLDMKASNIMLDSGFNANFETLEKASKESDIFSFGVVALEIACGRKVMDIVDQRSGTQARRSTPGYSNEDAGANVLHCICPHKPAAATMTTNSINLAC
ncbi:L-type lectin-domain containing receptor kinase IX.1-like protein [Tanacetum coccineum]